MLESVVRNHFTVRDTSGYVLSRHPIHFSGAAVFVLNPGDNDIVVTAEESDDGVTWNPIWAGEGLVNLSVIAKSMVCRRIESTRPFVRVRLSAVAETPAQVQLVQYVPVGREETAGYPY